jgi:hypothetical protein
MAYRIGNIEFSLKSTESGIPIGSESLPTRLIDLAPRVHMNLEGIISLENALLDPWVTEW